jgi:hypothetical protein
MSRRFLSALQRRDLSGIRRALFLEPLLMRNADAQVEQGREETGEDSEDGAEGPVESAPEAGPGPPERAPVPSDNMILPKPPPLPEDTAPRSTT